MLEKMFMAEKSSASKSMRVSAASAATSMSMADSFALVDGSSGDL